MRLQILSLVLVLAIACTAATTAATATDDNLIQDAAGDGYEWAALLEEDDASSQLSVVAQAFEEFASEHGRVYSTEEARAHAFAAFEANFHNANLVEMESDATPAKKPAAKPAATSGKTSSKSARRKPNSKVPRLKDSGKKVRVAAKKRTRRTRAQAKALAAQSKAGKLGQNAAAKALAAARAKAPASGAGRAGGAAGGVGGQSGKTGGQSGKTGGKSGKSGGQSGKTGGKSGKSGGNSGGTGEKSGKTGGNSGGNGRKSGKTGGDSGKTGKKSGKTGGVDDKTAKKSGKPGGTDKSLQPVLPPKPQVNVGASPTAPQAAPQPSGPIVDWLATKATASPADQARWAKAENFVQGLTQSAQDTIAGRIGNGAAGAVTPDSIREGMLAEGLSVDEVNAAFDRAKVLKLTKSVAIESDPSKEDFGVQTQAGSCGSCWAYSAIDAIQRILYDPSSPLYRKPLSAQQVIDCVRTADSNGCKGGSPMDAFDYFASNPIALASEYPPTGTSGACRTKEFAKLSRPYATGVWEMVIPACKDASGPCSGQIPLEAQLLEYWMSSNDPPPIVAYVDASNWADYKRGVFDISKCKSSTAAGNHLVVITGISTDSATGIPFWVIQNSWGSDWGFNGRIFLPAYVNACGLANFAVTVLPSKGSAVTRSGLKDARKESDASIKARMNSSLQQSRATTAAAAAAEKARQAAQQASGAPVQPQINDPLLAAIMAGQLPSSGSYDLSTNTMGKF